jgi:uncharacterized protein YwgA
MQKEDFRWLAGVIAAHPDGKIVSRTRLQKTIYLLQRKGLPTGFSYSLHFYGPYSDGLNTGLKLVRQLELVEEELKSGLDNGYYVYKAKPDAELPEMKEFSTSLAQLQTTPDVVLELAATYDAFREMGYPHSEAVVRLRQKKGAKCTPENEAGALTLLRQLGLPVES